MNTERAGEEEGTHSDHFSAADREGLLAGRQAGLLCTAGGFAVLTRAAGESAASPGPLGAGPAGRGATAGVMPSEVPDG